MATQQDVLKKMEASAIKYEDVAEAGVQVLKSEGEQDIPLPDGSTTPNLNKRLKGLVAAVTSVVGKRGDITAEDIGKELKDKNIDLPTNTSQEKINLLGGTDYWRNKKYPVNGTVRLDNGDIVISTIPENTNNPNENMTGWVFEEKTYSSVAEMLSIVNPKNKQRVYVESYNADQNAGGKFFVYSKSKSNVNDGGRCINGWIAQKEILDIHDFGTVKYIGSDWSGSDYNLSANAYYVSSVAYNNYKNYCNSVMQKAYFPSGDYVIQDGSYKLPKCGLQGDDKEGTRIFTALIQAGKIFEYNTLGVYSSGFANFIEDLTIYTHRANKACFVLTINTPSRGAKGQNVNIYSSGEINNYYDVWYLKWDNCGFYGYFRTASTVQTDPYTAVAFVNKNNGETNNTYYDKCSVLDVKHVFLGRKAGYTSSGVGLLFANCSFERIGECAFDLMYTNTTFLTCHFEQLGMHNGFRTPVNDFDKTILIYAGESTIDMLGAGNIWLGGGTPDSANYSIFNAEGRAIINRGRYKITKNSRSNIALVGKYASAFYCTLKSDDAVNSEATLTNPIDLHFTNTGSNFRAYAHDTGALKADKEKVNSTYQQIRRDTGLLNANASNRSLSTVTLQVTTTGILLRTKGRLYRIAGTATKCAQYIDVDATWLVTPNTPDLAIVLSIDCKLVGTIADGTSPALTANTSLFGISDIEIIKAGFKFSRKTATNPTVGAAFDVSYAMTFTGAYSNYWATSGGYYSIFDIQTDVIFAEDPTSIKLNKAYIHPNLNVAT